MVAAPARKVARRGVENAFVAPPGPPGSGTNAASGLRDQALFSAWVATSATCSGVKPYSLNSSEPGAEAP